MTETNNDLRIVREIANGNEEVFRQVFTQFRPGLVRYAAGVLAGDIDAAQDAVDEAFLSLWRSAARFRGDCTLAGWLRRITRNKAIDYIRRRRETTRGKDDSEDRLEDTDGVTPERSYLIQERSDQIRLALQELSADHRDVLWQCYFEHRTLAEIAEASEIPENTVKTRLYHARKQLGSLLEKRKIWP